MSEDVNKKSVGDTASHHLLMGILSYLGPLVIFPFLTNKDDQFIKFHTKQGFVLLAIEIIIWVLSSIFWIFWPFIMLIHFATFILSIIGIINVVQNKEKELPLVGHLSTHFKF